MFDKPTKCQRRLLAKLEDAGGIIPYLSNIARLDVQLAHNLRLYIQIAKLDYDTYEQANRLMTALENRYSPGQQKRAEY